jgi:hypothetical protein
MVWFPPFPDIETAIVQYLNADPVLSGWLAEAQTVMPDGLAVPSIRVAIVGGAEKNAVLDWPVVSVHAWHHTNIEAAEMAAHIRYLLMSWPCEPQTYGLTVEKVSGVTRPMLLPDSERGDAIPRYVQTFRFLYRA